MCGIVGVMKYNMSLSYIQRFRDLFTVAQLRGDDGAGVISVPKVTSSLDEVNYVHTKKTLWSSGHLVTLKDFDDVVKGDRSILVGHARQPTRGASKLENVHPHKHKNIVLVHNGTMNTVGGKAVPTGHSDSAMIAECIATKGVDHFVQNSFGAYALVWVDLNDQSLNFLRNSERSLWFCFEYFTSMKQNLDAIWWSSEVNFIQLVLSRYAGYNKDMCEYKVLPANEHWKFPLNFVGSLDKPEIEKREKAYKPTTTNPQSYWYSGYGDYVDPYEDVDQSPLAERSSASATSSSANSNASANGSALIPWKDDKQSGTTNDKFVYVPPEYRSSKDEIKTDSRGLSIATLLGDSKVRAMANATLNDSKARQAQLELIVNKGDKKDKDEKGGSSVPTTPFSGHVDLESLVCKDRKRIMDLVTAAPCVWCDEYPVLRKNSVPNIYPVRFTDRRNEYICSDCIQDPDTQRMVAGL